MNVSIIANKIGAICLSLIEIPINSTLFISFQYGFYLWFSNGLQMGVHLFLRTKRSSFMEGHLDESTYKSNTFRVLLFRRSCSSSISAFPGKILGIFVILVADFVGRPNFFALRASFLTFLLKSLTLFSTLYLSAKVFLLLVSKR